MSDMQFWKPHDFRETLYSEAFEVADYEYDIGFSEFKMADPMWQTDFKILCLPYWIRYMEF